MRYSFFSAFVLLLSFAFAESFAQAETKIIIKKIEESAMDEIIGAKDNRIVVDFMAAWCSPCIQELPELNRLYKKYRSHGFNLVGISIDVQGPQAMQPIVNRLGIGFPIYWYGERAILKYNLKAIPLLLFVRQGIIVERLRGKPPPPVLDQKIREFLE
jgi:thiol-disulfide isomerase/thioredoxin